jgi:hypothetical protein
MRAHLSVQMVGTGHPLKLKETPLAPVLSASRWRLLVLLRANAHSLYERAE